MSTRLVLALVLLVPGLSWADDAPLEVDPATPPMGPRNPPESASPPTTLGRADILGQMQPAAMELRRCLIKHTVWPVQVLVVISAKGRVTRVTFASGDEKADRRGQTCVIRKIKAMRFPRSDRETRFRYPLAPPP
jgi:hypothetical protein